MIQPPPMAYSPATDKGNFYGQGLQHAYYSNYNYHNGQSPFSPTLPSAPTSPEPTKGSLSLDSPMLGKALSDSSDSRVSSPARSSYGGFAPHAMRHSTISYQESNAQWSVGNVPVRDLEKQQVRSSRHTSSSRPRSYGYTTSAGSPRDEISGVLLESKAAKILVRCCVPRKLLRSQTNVRLAVLVDIQSFRLAVNPLVHALCPHRAITSSTTPIMRQKHHFPPPDHWVPRTNAENPNGVHILSRSCRDLQRASPNHDQSPLADHLIRRRNGSMGSSRLLVLQRHPRRPRWIRQTQRIQ